jgi:hypothetical protein
MGFAVWGRKKGRGKGEANMIPSLFYVHNESMNFESNIAHGRWFGEGGSYIPPLLCCNAI